MPVVAAARFVVSDIGDILSPRKAPETIAPTIRGAGKTILMPTPYRATPMVAMLPKEVPVKSDRMTHRRKVNGTIKDGDRKASL